MPDPMGATDPACGALLCYSSGSVPFCTDTCSNSASQAVEQSMCGGAGSTCLTQGDAPDDSSLCTNTCRPTGTTTATGACRAGFVCTGWWFTHASGTPDTTGCTPFCTTNAHCATGSVCNTRTGDCGTSAFVAARLPDGAPCNPTVTTTVPGSTTPQNVQCRGLCFSVSDTATQGICGSFIDLRQTTSCPDTPATLFPLAPEGTDNLGICIFKDCTRGTDCTAPLICRYPENASGRPDTSLPLTCDYATAAQPRSVR